ncbi:MAG: DUF364 domain-containing protein [Caldimicrobium sp.]|nr:DUF364 domain-containing protein [Caldimicrobium sp.]MCX7874381.1 DUF364 domain-containing protein [Caldimicrobium sp.]MDW8093507.1 DUF364 domain-containing protein [Caldimicrobium sp.]
MEGLYGELVNLALSLARAKRVKKVLVGLFYTLAEVERTGYGLAYTPKELIEDCCGFAEGALWREPADILVKKYLSSGVLESTVALAVINALLNNRKEILRETTTEDPLSNGKLTLQDEILMIGYIEPIFKKLERKVGRIWLIEREGSQEGLKIITETGKISLAIVTSATLVNKTFHKLVPYLEKIPEVILMGPSTPLAPELFKFTPVTWLSGVVVKEGDLLFRLICEGKGAPVLFKSGALQKVNLKIKRN